MKKVLLTILTALILIGIQPISQTNAASKNEAYPIFVDGQRVITRSKAMIEKGITLIPLEPVAKALDIKYTYNKNTKTATVTKDTNTATFVIGNKTVIVNGNKQAVALAPKIKGGEVYVPLATISNMANIPVNVDSNAKAVQIGEKVTLNQYFHMNFGMSKEQVKSIETRKLYHEGDNYAADMYQITYIGEFGALKFPGTISYFFKDNKLVEAYVDYASNTFDDSYSSYVNSYGHLNELYGEDEDDLKWRADSYTEDAYWKIYSGDVKGMFRAAIRAGDLSFMSKYEDDDTVITLIFSNTGTSSSPRFSTFMHFGSNTN